MFFKIVVLKIPENSQENTCAGDSFLAFNGYMVETDPSFNFRGPFAVKQIGLNS